MNATPPIMPDQPDTQPPHTDEPPSTPAPAPSVEDLTLAQMLGQFLRAPRRTWQVLVNIAGTPLNTPQPEAWPTVDELATPTDENRIGRPVQSSGMSPRFALIALLSSAFVLSQILGFLLISQAIISGSILLLMLYALITAGVGLSTYTGLKSVHGAGGTLAHKFSHTLPGSFRQCLKLGLWAAAFWLCVIGGYTLLEGTPRIEENQLARGAPYLLAGFLLWLLAELIVHSARWWENTSTDEIPAWRFSLAEVTQVYPLRILAALTTPLLMVVVWNQTANNQFRTPGFVVWLLSILCVLLAVAPASWSPLNLWRALARWNAERIARRRQAVGVFRVDWLIVAFLLILAVGIVFRLHDFPATPAQMTSDHKEKILDAQRVLQGSRDVFFMNNGGREAFQMYVMALFSQLPGQGMTHASLMLLAIIESIITLPIMFWLGRQIAGRDQREWGNLLGLILMLLLAVSYWHLTISRLALRIVLTPLVGALLLGFLIRAIRHNRRADFIAAGLVLGFGLYTYQAVRMMPVLVLAAVGIAALWNLRRWRVLLRYAVHLLVLVGVAFVVFLPLFRFSVDYPNSFWMRSAGRLFGDDVVQETDDDGQITLREANLEDRLTAFGANVPQLGNNIRNALLMFHWRGDEGWINGLPFHPQLDPLAGALLILGLAACGVLLVRTRDPVYVLLPVAVFIMVLPSALSIAMTNENPSATRASGAIPPTFALMSLPLLLLVVTLKRVFSSRRALAVSGSIIGLIAYLSLGFNWNVYYNQYAEVYRYRTWPYSIPGEILRGFHLSDGDYANAYMIGYTLWWDFRIIGLEAGIVDWPNGIVGIDSLPRWMSDQRFCGGAYPLRPDRDFLIFHHFNDDETADRLQAWFPDGYPKRIITYNSPVYDFIIFRVPALGEERFFQFVLENVEDPACLPPDAGIFG